MVQQGIGLPMGKDDRLKDKKLSYPRGTARRAMLVNVCYVSRSMGVRNVSSSIRNLHDLSRALTTVLFNQPHMISYQCSIATMSLSCTVSDI